MLIYFAKQQTSDGRNIYLDEDPINGGWFTLNDEPDTEKRAQDRTSFESRTYYQLPTIQNTFKDAQKAKLLIDKRIRPYVPHTPTRSRFGSLFRGGRRQRQTRSRKRSYRRK
jgi:hypothetical protein